MRIQIFSADSARRLAGPFGALLLVLVAFPMTSSAQQSVGNFCDDPEAQAGLCAPSILAGLNSFEQLAAAANQATFISLDPICSISGDARCSPTVRAVYEAVREFVHTANALSGDPFAPTEFSLDLDLEGLGFALRWSTAEEAAAQGAVTSRFAASQLNVLAARIADLRWGAGGLRMAYVSPGRREQTLLASLDSAGGANSATSDQWVMSRWSGFIDAAFGWGDREDTTFSGGFENAFDFDGKELNLGLDYRISNVLVVGGMFGYSDKRVDFNSSLSVVDGDIDSSGYSGQVFFLREGENSFLSGSLGYQWMEHDLRRRIVYPSNNANIAPTDSTALSSTDSGTFLASVGAGYQFRRAAFSAEPYIDLKYSDTTIDAFVERSFSNLLGGDSSTDPFALAVGRQEIDSLDSAVGLRIQYVLTPRFGVLIPYLHAAYHRELLSDSRTIPSVYAGAMASELESLPQINFGLPTDEPDEDYVTAIAGFSIVLPNGLQGYFQYLKVFDLDFYNQDVVSAGIRYEF